MVSLLRRVAIDITPLQRSKDFRRIWIGLLFAGAGFHFTVVASFVQECLLRSTGMPPPP